MLVKPLNRGLQDVLSSVLSIDWDQVGSSLWDIGDQMARWTNNLFSSTVHRAVITSVRGRYSIPYFFGPNYDTVIETFPSCISPSNPAQYAPVTTGEYIIGRFNQTFAYLKGGDHPAP